MQDLGFNLEFYKVTFTNYWWYGLFFVIYLVALVYIVRQKAGLMKQIFVWPFLILLITIFNPLVMEPILQMTGWQDRYSRFFWMLPVELLCAYVLACVIEKQQCKEEKLAIAVFVGCLIFLCGSSATKLELDDNIYKIDQTVIDVADRLSELSEKENPVVFYDEDLYYWIRQYNPSFVAALPYSQMVIYRWQDAQSIDTSEQYESKKKALAMFAQGVEVEPKIVNNMLKRREVEFFVRNKKFYSAEYMEQLNLVYVDTVDEYEIFRCTGQ